MPIYLRKDIETGRDALRAAERWLAEIGKPDRSEPEAILEIIRRALTQIDRFGRDDDHWSALRAAEYWISEEIARPGQTEPQEILRAIQAELVQVEGGLNARSQ